VTTHILVGVQHSQGLWFNSADTETVSEQKYNVLTRNRRPCQHRIRDAVERGNDEGLFPLTFHKGLRDQRCLFPKVGKLMAYQHRIETNLLQLFAHPKSSEWFSIISGIIFEVKIVDEQKPA